MVTLVVAGIVERDGRILLAQRPKGKSHGLLWEFPGGKVEEGETPEVARDYLACGAGDSPGPALK